MYGRIIYYAVLHDSLLLLDLVSDSKTDYTWDQINTNFIYRPFKRNSPFCGSDSDRNIWSALGIWAGFSETVRVSPRSAVVLSPPPPWPCQSTLHHHGNERPSGNAAVTGCRFTPAVTPTSSPPAGGMLGNWNRAKWAAVQHVRLSMGFHYPKQKHRVMLNNRFPSVSPQSNDSTLSLTWTWFSLEQP